MNIKKRALLLDTGLFDEDSFIPVKYMTVDNSVLFSYVLLKRMKNALFIVILSTTYLGIPACMAYALWFGIISGAFIIALIIRYGIKGIVLAAAAVFPQYIIYIPAFVMLIHLCMQVNREIYFNKYEPLRDKIKGRFFVNKAAGILITLLLIAVGCVLESYVNPYLLIPVLKLLFP
jgi:stage II sporulation protein M